MDPPSMVKSLKYSSTQHPMFSVVETRYPAIRDASLSSYHKSIESSQKSQEISHLGCGGAGEDTEISIFDAHKYFSCENNDPMKKQPPPHHHDILRLSSVSSTDGYARNFRTRSFSATPTALSEASWNSQTGLLVNPPGSVRVSLRKVTSDDGKKRSSAARRWIFGRKCCCSGEKSVEVKETAMSESEHGGAVVGATEENINFKSNFLYSKRDSQSQRSSTTNHVVLETHQQKVVAPISFPPPEPPRQQRISASLVGGFTFPILKDSNQISKGRIKKPMMNPLEDPPRDSLEVFEPTHEVERVLNTDDDVGSDASSDLFEIESFSTQTASYPMYQRRDSLDEVPAFNLRRSAAANGGINYGRRSLDEPPTPSVAATECYAPSEVSIDWSVTTAEGFDKASVSNFSISASEMGSAAFLRRRLQEETAGGGGSGKKKGNGGGLLMMGCRQEKAVSVGPQPVKCMAAEGGGVFTAQVGGRPPRAN